MRLHGQLGRVCRDKRRVIFVISTTNNERLWCTTIFVSVDIIDQASTEEASNTKYGFNVFSILRRDDEEVGLHSKFLAEILSSTGSHGMDTFQKLFIDQVVNVAVENQDWERLPLCPNQPYMCQTEVAIKNSGRIDVILKNNENIIVIENKINASDQNE